MRNKAPELAQHFNDYADIVRMLLCEDRKRTVPRQGS